MRDRSTCQYCHRSPPAVDLTLDHVIPRSRHGESTWENLVACCHSCNNRKGNRKPEEAGMKTAGARPPLNSYESRPLVRLLWNTSEHGGHNLFYFRRPRASTTRHCLVEVGRAGAKGEA